jgi:hypothetical protein
LKATLRMKHKLFQHTQKVKYDVGSLDDAQPQFLPQPYTTCRI